MKQPLTDTNPHKPITIRRDNRLELMANGLNWLSYGFMSFCNWFDEKSGASAK